MSVNLAPGPFGVGGQFFDSNGNPLNGGFAYTYAAGTTMPQPTYTTSAGNIANSNPMQMTADGRLQQEMWFTAGLAYKIVVTDSVGVVQFPYTMDNLRGINGVTISGASEWQDSGQTPVFVNTTSFTLTGDQTQIFDAGRRLRVQETAGTLYGFILSSSYSPGTTLTTVNVAMDSGGVLDSGLSAAAYGILNSVNVSTPKFIQAGSNITVTYDSVGRPVITAANPPPTAQNDIVNGSFSVNQRVTPPTTDNTYFVDAWRLMLGAANAATITQDTADVPIGAGYALKLTVGAATNNKFGIFQPIENSVTLKYRGSTCSIRVPLKATAALADCKIGILQWTGAADSISATPISSWNAAGTIPTLIANWSFANVPANLNVTTSWVDYTITGVSISASATNLGILIWQDDKTNTGADIMRIGGYVTFVPGSVAPSAAIASPQTELMTCQRYYYKTFPLATAPAQNAGTTSAFQCNSGGNPSFFTELPFPVRMRANPSVTTYNPSVANANWRDVTTGADRTVAILESTDRHVAWASTTTAANANNLIHVTADASL